MMSKSFALMTALLFIAAVITGCGGQDASHTNHGGHGDHENHAEMPDNIEVTASFQQLPGFLVDYTETTRTLYSHVEAHGDILRQLHCYCGCMDYNDPHDSLYRCFVAGTEQGVHWSDHGANCGICLLELRDVVQLSAEGKSVDEIKQHIVQTYGGAS